MKRGMPERLDSDGAVYADFVLRPALARLFGLRWPAWILDDRNIVDKNLSLNGLGQGFRILADEHLRPPL